VLHLGWWRLLEAMFPLSNVLCYLIRFPRVIAPFPAIASNAISSADTPSEKRKTKNEAFAVPAFAAAAAASKRLLLMIVNDIDDRKA